MKKAGFIITMVALAALAFSSCKTPERCPAYGNTDIPASTEVKA